MVILGHKVEIWAGVNGALLTTLKDRATQLLIKYKSGALVTQLEVFLTVDMDITISGFVSELRGESLFVG